MLRSKSRYCVVKLLLLDPILQQIFSYRGIIKTVKSMPTVKMEVSKFFNKIKGEIKFNEYHLNISSIESNQKKSIKL